MTAQTFRLKLVPPQPYKLRQQETRIKLRTLPSYPVSITGEGAITVTSNDGALVIGETGLLTGPAPRDVSGQLAIFSGLNNVDGIGVDATSFLTSTIEFLIDGGGVPITPLGFVGTLELPFACKIVQWTIMSDIAGNATIDIKKTTYTAPTGGASICGGNLPALVASQSGRDTVLTGWSPNLVQDDVLAFYVNAAGGPSKITISLKVTRY